MNLENSPITEEDFRAVVRILGDIAVMVGEPDDKRNHLMREVGLLLESDTWLWGVAPLMAPGSQPAYLLQNSGGIGDDRLAVMLKAIEHRETAAKTARLATEMIKAKDPISRLRQDVIDNDWFLNSPAQPRWQAADIGPYEPCRLTC